MAEQESGETSFTEIDRMLEIIEIDIKHIPNEQFEDSVNAEGPMLSLNSFLKKTSYLILVLLPICCYLFLVFVASSKSNMQNYYFYIMINCCTFPLYTYVLLKSSWTRALGSESTIWSTRTIFCISVYLILHYKHFWLHCSFTN